MSDIFWASFFSSLPLLLVSLGTLITAIRTSNRLGIVHRQINGMKSELVASTAKASLAEGKAAGVKEEQQRMIGNNDPS